MIKVYFNTEKLNDKQTLYGYQMYVNDILSETHIGVSNDDEKELTDTMTKQMMIKNKSLFKFDKLVYLKYKDLDLTKQMNYNVGHSSFYQEYRQQGVVLSCNPSVFLSDNLYNSKLKQSMNNYKLKYNYFCKTNVKKER